MAEPSLGDELFARWKEDEATRAQSRVIRGLDGDKEKAVHAMAMTDGDQDAAQYAFGNYDIASKAYRSRLAQAVVDGDPRLQTYLNNNPMATFVSRDDISNLTKYNQAMKPMSQMLADPKYWIDGAPIAIDAIESDPHSSTSVAARALVHALPAAGAGVAGYAAAGAAVGSIVPGLGTGAGFIIGLGGAFAASYIASMLEEKAVETYFPEEAARIKQGREEHPWAAIFGEQAAMLPFFSVGGIARSTLKYRLYGTAIAEGMELVQEELSNGELDPAKMIGAGLGGFLIAGKPTYFGSKAEAFGRAVGTGQFITRWFRHGEMPPLGANKAWDDFTAAKTKAGMDIYNDAMKAAREAETNESSPPLMESLSELSTKGEIGIKWDHVQQLYGDEMPAPGDGKLGDIPGVAEQFNNSLKTGEDISIPWKHWTHVDPEVEKIVHDGIRLPDSWTISEAKNIKPPTEQDWIEFPMQKQTESEEIIADVRRATGLGEQLVKPPAEPLKEPPPGEPPPAGPEFEETVLFEPGVLLPKRQYDRIVRDAEAVLKEDEAKKLEIEEKKARLRRTPEWNRRAAEMYDEVAADIDRRPDFVGWKFLTSGQISGQKLAIPKIDPKSLTPEQLEAFPKHWTKEGGLDVDLVAALSGFKTGDDFVASMVRFREVKGAESFGRFRDKEIQTAVRQQMEHRYGKFEDVTAAEARMYVISPRSTDLLWSEFEAMAHMAGQQMPFTRESVKATAAVDFGARLRKRATVKKVLDEMARAARETHDAWQAKDFVGAFKARQKVVQLAEVAREAKKWESYDKATNRLLKRLSKFEQKNMDSEFLLWAHRLMLDHEIPVERGEEEWKRMLDRPEITHKTFEDFVNSQNHPIDDTDSIAVGLPQGYKSYGNSYNPNLPVWDALVTPGGLHKLYDDFTVAESQGLGNTMRVLAKLGQDKSKGIIDFRGEDVSIEDMAGKLQAGIERFPVARQSWDPSTLGPLKIYRNLIVRLKTIDNMLMRFASEDERGPWARILYAIYDADHEYSRNSRQLADKIVDVFGEKDPSWWKKKLDNNVIKHPVYGTAISMDNERGVGLWLTSLSNDALNHTAAGWGLTPQQFEAYRNSVTTKEHYQMAKKIAEMYSWVQDIEDNVTMRRSGAMMERPEVGTIMTPWGEVPGQYYPRTRDTAVSPPRTKLDEHARNWVNMILPRGWAIKRTGDIYPVKFDLIGTAGDLQRRLKTSSYMPIADLYNKVLRRREIEDAIHRHFGPEYVGALRRYFNDIGGANGMSNEMEQMSNYLFNRLSRNVITDVIGFNLSTLEKHGSQSAIQSALELGLVKGFPLVFKNAARKLLNVSHIVRDENIKFMHEGGIVGGREVPGNEELRNRRYRLGEDPYEVTRAALGRRGIPTKYGQVPGSAAVETGIKKLSEFGGWPIGFVDQQMSEITWLARYEQRRDQLTKEFTQNKQMGTQEWLDAEYKAHQLASDMADRMVRITHGSTSIVGKAEWMRSQNAMVRTGAMALNFFNNALNRRFRSLYMIQDMVKGRSPRPVMQDVGTIIRDLFTYVVLPTLIEDLVEPIATEDDDWATMTGKYVAQAAFAPIPIVRDIVHAIITQQPMSYGVYSNLLKYAYKTTTSGVSLFEDDSKFDEFAENLMGLVGGLAGAPLAVPGRLTGYLLRVQNGEDDIAQDWDELHRVLKKGRTQESKHEAERKSLLHLITE